MTSQRNFEYRVVKYVPNAAGKSDVIIGVILLEAQTRSGGGTDPSRLCAGLRFIPDWIALTPFVSEVDLEVVRAIVDEISSKCRAASSEHDTLALVDMLRELGSASNGVIVGPPKGLVAEDSDEALDDLATRYLSRPSDSRTVGLGAGGGE